MNLTTERLHLRPFTPEDITPFQIMCANPEVMRYIGPTTPEQLAESVQAWIVAYHKHGYGLLAVEHLADQRFIGFCGLLHQEVEGQDYLELGYRFDADYWGQGLATEATMAVKTYALQHLPIDTLISIIHPDNHRSKRVASKCGAHFWRSAVFKTIPVELYRYSQLG